jgi:hypothetical protein
MFDYYDTFMQAGAQDDQEFAKPANEFKQFISEFNLKSLAHSIRNQEVEDEITSIYINYPALLLRKKSEMYPNGRTSHRFKNALRRRVTIVDKNQHIVDEQAREKTEVDEAEGQETSE